MPRDIRQTETYAWAQEFYERTMTPGFGTITGAMEPDAHPGGGPIAVTGAGMSGFEVMPKTRICLVDSNGLREISTGPHDRLPRWTPDGAALTFLSDRAEAGVHQLFVLREGIGEAEAVAPVDGAVEWHHVSPDSSRVLLGVAERGADLAGGQGSGTIGGAAAESLPSWMPEVRGANETPGWRRLWLHDFEAGTTVAMSREGLNVWEAAWCGPDTVIAIVSDSPSEQVWYTAELVLIDTSTGKERPLARSGVQLGVPTANASGTRTAVVQALASDRWVVAGDVVLVDPGSGATSIADTLGVDVTWMAWRDETTLSWLGIRGLDTVAGELDVTSGVSRETWSSNETCGLRYPEASISPDGLAVVLSSAVRAPSVATVGSAGVTVLADLAHAGSSIVRDLAASTRPYRWTASDGLEIEGLLTVPAGQGPFPLVLYVHGGPVWAFRDSWSLGYPFLPAFVERGYAILRPNPRGSSGRGQDFIAKVYGDMGGDDTGDYLSAIDALVADGIADPARLAVTGGSYGGFISSWLITQTDRFAASMPMAEVSNWISQHYTSNIPFFDTIFLGSAPKDPAGNHFARSPVFLADKVTTPSLHITGGLDRCTPAGQAIEFHTALQEAGAHSELVIYPEEGHGVRAFPAAIDVLARMVDFLDTHCAPR